MKGGGVEVGWHECGGLRVGCIKKVKDEGVRIGWTRNVKSGGVIGNLYFQLFAVSSCLFTDIVLGFQLIILNDSLKMDFASSDRR